jgi:hypothetical protein
MNKWSASTLLLLALVIPSLLFLVTKGSYYAPALYIAAKFAQDAVIGTVIFAFGRSVRPLPSMRY